MILVQGDKYPVACLFTNTSTVRIFEGHSPSGVRPHRSTERYATLREARDRAEAFNAVYNEKRRQSAS